jgi:transcriptional regulator GlxA family with amidase domain
MGDLETGTRIAVALFNDAEELDWAGPWEVLSCWAHRFPDDGVRTFTVASTAEPVTCANGLRVIPDRMWADSGRVDVLVYPGGRGTRPQLNDEATISWLRTVADSGALLTSVCTGALVLASAGLLDGHRATTHRDALRQLAALGKNIDVRTDERFVDDGDVVTAAGVSAGIDMALHLVARLHSAGRAREVRRRIEYDPSRPCEAAMSCRPDLSDGNRS